MILQNKYSWKEELKWRCTCKLCNFISKYEQLLHHLFWTRNILLDRLLPIRSTLTESSTAKYFDHYLGSCCRRHESTKGHWRWRIFCLCYYCALCDSNHGDALTLLPNTLSATYERYCGVKTISFRANYSWPTMIGLRIPLEWVHVEQCLYNKLNSRPLREHTMRRRNLSW